MKWNGLVLDEAQNIKNASTRAAQAARAIGARWRVALTGTPVENRLADLWSIFQVINPGLPRVAPRSSGASSRCPSSAPQTPTRPTG